MKFHLTYRGPMPLPGLGVPVGHPSSGAAFSLASRADRRTQQRTGPGGEARREVYCLCRGCDKKTREGWMGSIANPFFSWFLSVIFRGDAPVWIYLDQCQSHLPSLEPTFSHLKMVVSNPFSRGLKNSPHPFLTWVKTESKG